MIFAIAPVVPVDAPDLVAPDADEPVPVVLDPAVDPGALVPAEPPLIVALANTYFPLPLIPPDGRDAAPVVDPVALEPVAVDPVAEPVEPDAVDPLLESDCRQPVTVT